MYTLEDVLEAPLTTIPIPSVDTLESPTMFRAPAGLFQDFLQRLGMLGWPESGSPAAEEEDAELTEDSDDMADDVISPSRRVKASAMGSTGDGLEIVDWVPPSRKESQKRRSLGSLSGMDLF